MLLLLLLWVPLTLSAVLPQDAFIFRRNCNQSNNNGICEMICRDLENNFEMDDCLDIEMEERMVALTIDMSGSVEFSHILNEEVLTPNFVQEELPIHVHEWGVRKEIPFRKALSTEVKLKITPEQFKEIGYSCLGSEQHLNHEPCLITLNFTLFAKVCENCQTLDDVLDLLNNPTILDQLKIRSVNGGVTRPGPFPLFLAFAFAGVVIAVLLIAGVTYHITHHVTSRKRKIVTAACWMPPPEKKMALSSRFQKPAMNNSLEQLIDGEYGMQDSFDNRSPPKWMPPSVKSASQTNYNSAVVAVITNLHDLARSELPSTKENDVYLANMAEKLVKENQIDIDAVDHSGETAFMWAVRSGRKHLAHRLLSLGSDGNRRHNFSALHHAVLNSDIYMLKTLLGFPQMTSVEVDGRPAIDALDHNSMTPLMMCGGEMYGVEMGRDLIAAGAKIDDQGEQCNVNFTGETALHYAAKHGNLEFVKLLVETAETQGLPSILDIKNHQEDTPLCMACSYNHYTVAQYLLEKGADLHQGDTTRTPKEIAEKMKFEQLVKLLDDFKEKNKSVDNSLNKHAVKKLNAEKKPRLSNSPPSSKSGSSPEEPNGFQRQDAIYWVPKDYHNGYGAPVFV